MVFINKQVFVILFLLCASRIGLAQITGRFYYNAYWELTLQDSAIYFRMCVFDTTHSVFAGPVQDFTRTAKLLMKGNYKGGKKDGEFIFYYPSGQVESIGSYTANQRVGHWKYFYKNGVPKQEVEFDSTAANPDLDPKIVYYDDSLGTRLLKDGNGLWAEEYDRFRGDYHEHIEIKGQYRNGVRTGAWTMTNGYQSFTVKFKNGELQPVRINGRPGKTLIGLQYSILPSLNRLRTIEEFAAAKSISRRDYPFLKSLDQGEDDSIQPLADIYPEFPGGNAVLVAFIASNYQAPSRGRKIRILVSFIIEKDGSVSNVELVQGLSKEFDKEAIRMVRSFPSWSPAYRNKKPVRYKLMLPININ